MVSKEKIRNKLAKGPRFFKSLLRRYSSVLAQPSMQAGILSVIVKSTLSIALIMHDTRSFSKTIRHVFSCLRGAPAFSLNRINDQVPGWIWGSAKKSNDDKILLKYIDHIISRSIDQSNPDFIKYRDYSLARDLSGNVKAIAFYLPQFHAFDLNDEWYGKGFSEWNNVTKAIPQYTGHYQPQLPIDTGYYDLNNIAVMFRQVELAKNYGIQGFCFHYYWFSGCKLMEMPLANWLKNKEIDFPFCLNWANENWSKLWDGGNREVRYKQELLPGDDEKFFADILPFFKDPRYIKVDGKPLLLIYRVHLFDLSRVRKFIKILRDMSLEHGFPGIYIASVNSHSFQENPGVWGLDAMVEFPPHCMLEHGLKEIYPDGFINPNFDGHVWDGKDYVQNKRFIYDTSYKLFKGVFPSWDNTPRKAYSNGSVIEGVTPKIYQKWLSGCIKYTRNHLPENERFIFINAWNEWAEGAHLEPDSRYGYAYLQATRDALQEGS